MKKKEVIDHIVSWLHDYADNAGLNGFVIGVSGGVDSALVSTLCAMTGKPTIVVNMPIYQAEDQITRGMRHIEWLEDKYENVTSCTIDLTETFDIFAKNFGEGEYDNLSMANARSRLRMTTLYSIAGFNKMLVAGTGNRVEDYGVGFFTKYGDGGVDISPIGGLMKTEVRALAKELNIIEEIVTAIPTDGLWDDGRTDEDQLGMTYEQLETAMTFFDGAEDLKETNVEEVSPDVLSDEEQRFLSRYLELHRANSHKMAMPPICEIPEKIK